MIALLLISFIPLLFVLLISPQDNYTIGGYITIWIGFVIFLFIVFVIRNCGWFFLQSTQEIKKIINGLYFSNTNFLEAIMRKLINNNFVIICKRKFPLHLPSIRSWLKICGSFLILTWIWYCLKLPSLVLLIIAIYILFTSILVFIDLCKIICIVLKKITAFCSTNKSIVMGINSFLYLLDTWVNPRISAFILGKLVRPSRRLAQFFYLDLKSVNNTQFLLLLINKSKPVHIIVGAGGVVSINRENYNHGYHNICVRRRRKTYRLLLLNSPDFCSVCVLGGIASFVRPVVVAYLSEPAHTIPTRYTDLYYFKKAEMLNPNIVSEYNAYLLRCAFHPHRKILVALNPFLTYTARVERYKAPLVERQQFSDEYDRHYFFNKELIWFHQHVELIVLQMVELRLFEKVALYRSLTKSLQSQTIFLGLRRWKCVSPFYANEFRSGKLIKTVWPGYEHVWNSEHPGAESAGAWLAEEKTVHTRLEDMLHKASDDWQEEYLAEMSQEISDEIAQEISDTGFNPWPTAK